MTNDIFQLTTFLDSHWSRDELVLSRIRIGHSYRTHITSWWGETPPEYVSCQERLTVSHILVHRAEYIHIRDNHYRINNVKEILNLVNPANIICFFKSNWSLFINLNRVLNSPVTSSWF